MMGRAVARHPPGEFQKLYLDEVARWTDVIKAAGLKPE